MEGWGNPALLRHALNKVWEFLAGGLLEEEHIRELVKSIEAVTPDSEDFMTLFTGPAQNAAAAVIYTLECCLDGNPERAAMVGRVATDTIDSYLYGVSDPDTGYHTSDPQFDAWVEKSPLMSAELQKQRLDIHFLKSSPILDKEALHRLRHSSSTSGLQPVARGIVKPTPH